jgi:hypothetical protein
LGKLLASLVKAWWQSFAILEGIGNPFANCNLLPFSTVTPKLCHLAHISGLVDHLNRGYRSFKKPVNVVTKYWQFRKMLH